MTNRLILGALAASLLAWPAAAQAPNNHRQGDGWTASMERAIDTHLRYPAWAVQREPRSVEVTFTVAADGRMTEAVVIRSTGVLVLDDAAVEAVRRTRAVAPPPSVLVDHPIIYRATFSAEARATD